MKTAQLASFLRVNRWFLQDAARKIVLDSLLDVSMSILADGRTGANRELVERMERRMRDAIARVWESWAGGAQAKPRRLRPAEDV